MVVAGAGDARSEQPLPFVHGTQDRRAEHEKLQVLVRVGPRTEQVVPLIVADRPVEVFARSIDAGERLFVQQAGKPVTRGCPPHRLHGHHLMIGGQVGVLEYRSDLVLARRHFVVAGFHRHPDPIEFRLDVVHKRHCPVGDPTEVLILEFLALGWFRPEQRSAGINQIGT
jgi:hypothetical protein